MHVHADMYGDMENVDHLHTFQQLPTYTYAQRFHGKNMQTIFLWPLKLKSIRLYKVFHAGVVTGLVAIFQRG